MTESLELIEQSLYQIKAMLKEPDYQLFGAAKAQALNSLKLVQAEARINPLP